MTKISSRATFIYKKGFPILWFGFLFFFIAQALWTRPIDEDLPFIIIPCVMIVIGFFVMKKFVWDLADEVYDDGGSLLVRFRSEEDRISLSNIMNVSASTNMNPPRITLRLARSGKFGADVSFSPVTGFTLNPFAKNKVAEDLIVRVDQARRSTRAA
jgi:hypothetical protein